MGVIRRIATTATTAAMAVVGIVVAPAAPASATTIPTTAPSLVAPADNASVGGNPVFQWSAVPNAVKYRFQVSSSQTFSPLLYNVDTYALHATPTTDLPVTRLYWRVAATDGSTGVGPYASRQFVKNTGAGPVLSAPANGAVLHYPTQQPILRWSALTGMKQYKVELDDADDFNGCQTFTTANTSLALTEPLILKKDYYWRVQGISTANVAKAYSATWSFRMDWPDATGKPTLLAPPNDAVTEVTDVVFRWSPVAGAKSYQIQVSSNPDFTINNNITDDRVVKGTQYSPAMTYDNATYYWHVRALDTASSQHQGPWSDSWMFRRDWTEKPVAISPIGKAATTGQRFAWTGVKHASHYELQIAPDSNFSTLVGWCTTFHTTFTPVYQPTQYPTVNPPLPTGPPYPVVKRCDNTLGSGFRLTADHHYFWRVRGVDAPGLVNGQFSDTAEFIYTPGIPEMAGPADHAVTAAPVLTWDPVPEYDKYKVTIIKDPGGTPSTTTTYGTSYTPTTALAGGDYSWYVIGVKPGDVDGLSPTNDQYRHFTVVAPGVTNDLDPLAATDAPSQATPPSLTWHPVSGATGYNVYAGLVGGGNPGKLNSDKLPYPAYTHTGLLAPGVYQWHVEAINASDTAFQTSDSGTFTISDQLFATYDGPPNCTIANCPTVQQTTPELRWKPVPGASLYRVWVALDPNFTNIIHGYETGHTTLTPRESYPDNAAGQSYYWYVQPCQDSSHCGPFQGPELTAREQAFRKLSPPVTLKKPDNTLTPDLADVVSFSWQDYTTTTAGKVGVKQYRVQVATDSSFTSIVDDVKVDQPVYQAYQKSYPDNVYYWRVQAIDGGDVALAWSATWKFQKTQLVPAPTSTGTTTGLPTLTWNALPYGSGYNVEIYSGASSLYPSNSKVLTATTKLPSYTPSTALPAGAYSWRVRKLDPDGNTGRWWTVVPTFTVARPAPALTAPADLTKIKSNDMLFSWQAVTGASSYQFESSTSATFTSVVEQKTTVMTFWAPVVRYPDVTGYYYWRVKVLDGSGNVMATSAARRIQKDSTPPKVKSVSPTSGLAVDGTITVTFSEPVKGVSAAGLTLRIAGTTNAVAGTVTPVSTTVTTTATYRPTAPLVAGQYYDLTVGSGITDVIGNLATVSTTRVRVALTVESTSPALTERWDVDSSSAASGGAYISSSIGGATATFRFAGTSVSVLGHASNVGGNADIYVDGVKQTTTPISFYSTTPRFQKTVYSKTGLANTSHTLMVRVLGTKPAGSGGAYVDLDAFVAGTPYQESSSAVTTRFGRISNTNASGGTYEIARQEADSSGAEYRFSFRGTGFTWCATKLPSGGNATVYIDGVNRGTVKLNASSPQYRAAVFNSPTLPDSVHSVRIIATGPSATGAPGTDVTVDSLTIR